MSFREKSAWITLVSVLLCFGVYFGAAFATHWFAGDPRANGWTFLGCVAAFVVLQIGLNLIALWTTPKDGRTPKDERERTIQARSHTIGYYVLVVLVLMLGVPLHLGHVHAHQMMMFALMGVVVTGLVVSVAQIVMFRRGF
jgi:hypothetical protein